MSQAASVLRFRSFALPKQGNSRKEYEDACAHDSAKARFAIADGASESIYAGEWATLLAEAFVAHPVGVDHFADWLSAVQAQWLTTVKQGSLPWYVEEKLHDGAFATFLGLKIRDAADGAARTWRALAVGDSCLFHIHGDKLKLAFPVAASAGFGTRPHLLGSRKRAANDVVEAKGSIAAGDHLLLMTDAAAQWFLTQHEAGRKPWGELLRLTENDFPAWVDSLRESGRMKNDDVTILAIAAEAARK